MTDREYIENKVRHAFNKGYGLGFKDGKEKAKSQEPILDKIRAEIVGCLKALDDIEKSGFNIYLPNEISGRRLTYQQCLEIIDKYKGESEPQEISDRNLKMWIEIFAEEKRRKSEDAE